MGSKSMPSEGVFRESHLIRSINSISADVKHCLSIASKPKRALLLFWLCGPFILLIERTPSDIWLTSIALTFLIRSVYRSDFAWLENFWVKAIFLFWLCSIFSSVLSENPRYSVVETLIWLRFSFCICPAFWLGADYRILRGTLLSTTAGVADVLHSDRRIFYDWADIRTFNLAL